MLTARRPFWLAAFSLCFSAVIAGCSLAPLADPSDPKALLDRVLPVDVLLLGEQHDAPDHQRMEREVVHWLANRARLAALLLEMAERGQTTADLPRTASEAQVQTALQWKEAAWRWRDYGPAVMAAVRQGVPVLGANLPAAQMTAAMKDDRLDALLRPSAFKAQQQRIRTGHCDMLPETQITPMTRIQIARDQAMAGALRSAILPGKTVVLLAGSGHVDRDLGVPQHLGAGVRVGAVVLQAGPGGDDAAAADLVWPTPALPQRDYCADFRRRP